MYDVTIAIVYHSFTKWRNHWAASKLPTSEHKDASLSTQASCSVYLAIVNCCYLMWHKYAGKRLAILFLCILWEVKESQNWRKVWAVTLFFKPTATKNLQYTSTIHICHQYWQNYKYAAISCLATLTVQWQGHCQWLTVRVSTQTGQSQANGNAMAMHELQLSLVDHLSFSGNQLVHEAGGSSVSLLLFTAN